MNYNFEVKTLESGQRGAYQDSFYSYEVTSHECQHLVKSFCMNVLRKSYENNEMPNPFAGRLLSFEKITDNNKDAKRSEPSKSETYLYKTTELYTG